MERKVEKYRVLMLLLRMKICLQAKNNELSRREGKERKWLLKAKRQGQRGDHKKMRKEEMDKEIKETRERLDRMMQKMQQEAQGSWRYEWPMKQKVKWPIQQLISKKQKHMLRRWLRKDENLSDTEEDMVCICEPEDGENLSEEEERSTEDLTDFQEGNEKRSIEDPIDCQEGRKKI
jgi:hypothetical protein